MLIQILLSLFIFFALIKVAGRYRVKEVTFGNLFFWYAFWIVVALVVWQPQLATDAANLVGVGRGADLVLYVSVAVLFYSVFRLTVRLEKMDRNVTKIVSEIAIKKERE